MKNHCNRDCCILRANIVKVRVNGDEEENIMTNVSFDVDIIVISKCEGTCLGKDSTWISYSRVASYVNLVRPYSRYTTLVCMVV